MVSFEMVKDIFDEMASAGGKFYEMQEKQAQSLRGKISNLIDSFEIALNDIGAANDGLLKGSVEAATYLVNNWEDVARVLGALIATYGTYKAAMLSTLAIEKLTSAATFVKEYMAMGKALGFATANMIAFNKASLANPYVIAAGLALTVGSLILFNKNTATAAELTENLSQSVIGLENSGGMCINFINFSVVV